MKNRKRKTILVLAGPMGSGHVRAALAVKEALGKKYPDARVIYEDTTVWMSPFCRWIFLKLYPFLLAHFSWIWRLIHNAQNSTGNGLFPFIFSISDYKEKKHVKDLVARKKVDLIISTHFYPGFFIDEMKRDGQLKIPATLVVTDHVAHRIYARKWHDLIFVPSQETIDKFVQFGVAKEKMRISGIPVFSKFRHDYPEADLRRFCKELNLKDDRYYVMLCMGGWATGDMRATARSLLKADKDFTLLVMTAYNHELFRQFSLMAAEDERIHPVSYTDQIEKYMALCTVIVTKPGGITTSECIAMRKLMLLADPIAGHEENNLRYLIEQDLAVTPNPGETLTEAGIRLKNRFDELDARMNAYAPLVENGSSFIAEESMALIPEEQG